MLHPGSFVRVVCGGVRWMAGAEIVIHLSLMTYNYTHGQGAHLIGQLVDWLACDVVKNRAAMDHRLISIINNQSHIHLDQGIICLIGRLVDCRLQLVCGGTSDGNAMHGHCIYFHSSLIT
jgi:hypothetical protein